MDGFTRSALRITNKRLLLGCGFLLFAGAGTSQAQTGCPKPVFRPFDESINVYTSFGMSSAAIDFQPSVEDSTSVVFGYNMTGATVAAGTGATGSGTSFSVGVTNVEVSATNTCGSTTMNFTVLVERPFQKFGEFGGHHYFRTPRAASWHEADSMAKSIGAQLVAINSPAESYFLSRAVPDTMRAWIGLNKESGVWKWSNGDPYVLGDTTFYQNWCPNQPDNWMGGQDYGMIHSEGVPVGTDICWDDAHSPKVPGSSIVNLVSAIVEMKPYKCNGTIVAASNMYLGYGSQTETFTASSLGIPGLTYSWSGLSTSMLSCTKCAQPEFTPRRGGNYAFSVKITDATGCTTTATKNICVKDIRDGSSGNVWICHSGKDTSVAPSDVISHLSHGDQLGKCGQTCGNLARYLQGRRIIEASEIKVYPNPTRDAFFVEIPQTEEETSLSLLDIQGKVLETRKVASQDSRKVQFNLGSSPLGLYIVEVTHGEQRFRVKLVRQ